MRHRAATTNRHYEVHVLLPNTHSQRLRQRNQEKEHRIEKYRNREKERTNDERGARSFFAQSPHHATHNPIGSTALHQADADYRCKADHPCNSAGRRPEVRHGHLDCCHHLIASLLDREIGGKAAD